MIGNSDLMFGKALCVDRGWVVGAELGAEVMELERMLDTLGGNQS